MPYPESYCIIEENEPAARSFASHAKRITAKLLGEDPDTFECPVKFELSYSAYPNAAILTNEFPPVIFLSKGLLKLAGNEDEIAAVIAHELTHREMRNRLGVHKNGKLEEMFCDIEAVQMLRMAGYRQDAMRDILSKLPESAYRNIFHTITDAHPDKEHRISACKIAEKRLDSSRMVNVRAGKQDSDFTPKPAELMEKVEKDTSLAGIDKEFASLGYDDASLDGRLTILARLIEREIPRMTDDGDSYAYHQISRKMYDLKIKENMKWEGADKQALDHLVDVILKTRSSIKHMEADYHSEQLYKDLARKVDPISPHAHRYDQDIVRPIGQLRDMSDAMLAFTYAKTPEEAITQAQSLNRLVKKYQRPEYSANILKGITFARFVTPAWHQLSDLKNALEGEKSYHTKDIDPSDPDYKNKVIERMGIVPNWDKQVQWAQAGHSPEIAAALLNMGIQFDPRVEKLLPPDSMPPAFIRMEEFDMTPDGKVIAGGFPAGHTQKKRQQEKMSAERDSVLKSGDWKREFETDQSAFYAKYREQLLPFSEKEKPQDRPMQDAFAQHFIEHMESLVAKDAARWQPVANDFFVKILPEFMQEITRREAKKARYYDAPGIPLDHPYIQAAIRNDLHLSLATRVNAIDHTHKYIFQSTGNDTAADHRQSWPFDLDALLPLPPAKSLSDIADAISHIESLGIPILKNHPVLCARISHYACEFLEQNQTPFAINDLPAIAELATILPEGYNTLFDNLLKRATEISVQAFLQTSPSAEELADAYARLNDSSLRNNVASSPSWPRPELFFNLPELKQRFETQLQSAIEKIGDPVHKAEILEGLLFNKSARHRYRFKIKASDTDQHRMTGWQTSPSFDNPELRKFLIDSYVDAKATSLGGMETARNHSAIDSTISHIGNNSSGSIRFSILAQLAEKVETQKELSKTIEHYACSDTFESLFKDQMKFAFGEGGLKYLYKDSQTRLATLDFLRSPLTPESVETLRKPISTSFDKHNPQLDKTPFINGRMEESQQKAALQNLHRGFWQMPMVGRQLIAKLLMFPAKDENDPQRMQHHVEDALDKIFPVAKGEERPIGRTITEAYLEACDKTSKQDDVTKYLLLAAMLVSKQPKPEKPGEEKTAEEKQGEALKNLEAFGPAGHKLLQAIHSHTKTPFAIKKAIKDSKSMADKPYRWDVFNWLEAFGPETIAGNPSIKHVGKVLGAGAYGVTVETERDTHENAHTAVTLLRPNADILANDEFERFSQAASILVTKLPNMDYVQEMVDQARKMSHLETNMDVAKKQASYASENTDGFKVMVGGKTFTFSTAQWIGHGPRYKETTIIPGKHFNDFTSSKTGNATPEALQERHDNAVAIMAKHLYFHAMGKRSDHDRHGNQQRIVGSHIGEFDFGGMALDEPTGEQKHLLGELMMSTLKAAAQNDGILERDKAFMQQIKLLGDTPGRREYLATLQRDFLATNDYMNTGPDKTHPDGVTDRDFKSIFSAIVKMKALDKDVRAGMNDYLGFKERCALDFGITGIKGAGAITIIPNTVKSVTEDASPSSRPAIHGEKARPPRHRQEPNHSDSGQPEWREFAGAGDRHSFTSEFRR